MQQGRLMRVTAIRILTPLAIVMFLSTSPSFTQTLRQKPVAFRAQSSVAQTHGPSRIAAMLFQLVSWTPGDIRVIAGVSALCILVALLWVWELRRRVREQTGIIMERLRREVALEERYRDLFENAHDVVLTTDLNHRLTSLN
ncbi:MAG: hypothetical protein ACRD2G_00520, partial [Terriglobia bacterium]